MPEHAICFEIQRMSFRDLPVGIAQVDTAQHGLQYEKNLVRNLLDLTAYQLKEATCMHRKGLAHCLRFVADAALGFQCLKYLTLGER
jgi:hypothetical protein